MKKILFVALAIAGISSPVVPGQAFARQAPLNGLNLQNGLVLVKGADLGGLSLEGVIFPEAAE